MAPSLTSSWKARRTHLTHSQNLVLIRSRIVKAGRVLKPLKEAPVTTQISVRPKYLVSKEKKNLATKDLCARRDDPQEILQAFKEVYKRPGKGSRTRRKPLPRNYHKSSSDVDDYTGVILKFPAEMVRNRTRGFRGHIKRELEHAIIKTTRSWILSVSKGHMIADGSNRMFEVDVIFGKLFKFVKHLEAVTGTQCPHPAVLGGFLLGQESNAEWHDMVWSGYVGVELKRVVHAYAVDVAFRAGLGDWR